MKRLIIVPLLLACVTVPATTAGGSADGKDTFASKRGTTVAFDVFTRNNKPVGVDNFEVKQLPISCKQGDALLNFKLKKSGDRFFGVNDNKKFSAVSDTSRRKLKVAGEFVTNNKVEGRVSAEGKFNVSGQTYRKCSGSEKYTAGQTR